MGGADVASCLECGVGGEALLCACDDWSTSSVPARLRTPLYRAVFAFCRACGAPTDVEPCVACGRSTACAGPSAFGALGGRLGFRDQPRSGPYIVIGSATDLDGYYVADATGTVQEVPAADATSFEPLEGSWTPAGAVLAGAAEIGSQFLEAVAGLAAVSLAGDLPAVRGLLRDADRLERHDIEPLLDLTDEERTWWLATRSCDTEDEVRSAALDLLELPLGTFPARMLIWERAANENLLAADALDEVGTHLDALGGVDPRLAVVAALVRRTFAAGPPDVAEVAASARQAAERDPEAGWDQLTSDEYLFELGGGPGRFLRSVSTGAHVEARDLPHLHMLPKGALEVLVRTRTMAPWIGDARTPSYVRARLAPERLSEDELLAHGMHHERARRALATGSGLPADLDDDTVQAFARVDELRSQDPLVAWRALQAFLEERDPDATAELEELIEGEGGAPGVALLGDELARRVLRRTWVPDLDRVDVGALDDEQRDFVALYLVEQARDLLQEWDWSGAEDRATLALAYGRSEGVRDETLNVLACALWEQGRDSEAIAALRTALDGEYTESLQANMAVVAAEFEPALAGEHLARLVVEAPTPALRVSAARKAVELWKDPVHPWEEDDPYALPPSLAQALRDLVVQDLVREDFHEIVRLLAEHDGEWLAGSGRLKSSPHRDSDEAKVWIAYAQGFDKFVRALAMVLRTSSPPSWAEDERDRLADIAIGGLASEDPSAGAVGLSMRLIEAGVPLDPSRDIRLRAFAARGVAMVIDLDEGEPDDKFVDWLEHADRRLSEVSGDERTELEKLLEAAFSVLTVAYYQHRAALLDDAGEFYNRVLAEVQALPSWQVNLHEVRTALAPVVEMCVSSTALFQRLRKHVSGDLREGVDGAIGTCSRAETTRSTVLATRGSGMFWGKRAGRVEMALDEVVTLTNRIESALVVRDPGNARSVEAYEGLRKAVTTAMKERRQHLTQLVEMAQAIERGVSIATLRSQVDEWCELAGLARWADPDPPEWFDIVDGQGEDLEVLDPAWVDRSDPGSALLVQQGRARRVPRAPVREVAANEALPEAPLQTPPDAAEEDADEDADGIAEGVPGVAGGTAASRGATPGEQTGSSEELDQGRSATADHEEAPAGAELDAGANGEKRA